MDIFHNSEEVAVIPLWKLWHHLATQDFFLPSQWCTDISPWHTKHNNGDTQQIIIIMNINSAHYKIIQTAKSEEKISSSAQIKPRSIKKTYAALHAGYHVHCRNIV